MCSCIFASSTKVIIGSIRIAIVDKSLLGSYNNFASSIFDFVGLSLLGGYSSFASSIGGKP